MNLDFTYDNPTRIHFGRTALSHLKEELDGYGENVLLVYGRNAIKSMGLYDEVIKILTESGKRVTELSGIKSNPTYRQLLEGARLVRENQIDLILAVGGGSVIDCAKGISLSAYCEGDPWQRYWVNFEPVDNQIVPVGCILTMAGTASEMNGGSVITNEDEMIKGGRTYPANVNPRFSILNPEYTFSVPKRQMVSGIFDTFSHLMEQYFTGEDDNTTDYIIEGVMESLIHSARIALKNPEDYEARSNLMWCATMGLNKITGLSKAQDWEVHMIEHQLGAYTDCPHGEGLAIISVPYYRYIYQNGMDKFVRFAKRVWGIDTEQMSKDEAALAGIEALSEFIRELGLPTTLREIGTTEEMLPKIAASSVKGGGYRQMEEADILQVLKACW
ncbi:MAG: iron-containing alcohol dehydrogenase [Eubacteriales bacterium]|nr:iron-containing alcohol dehydrogenase [Eubacteriales bacterium]